MVLWFVLPLELKLLRETLPSVEREDGRREGFEENVDNLTSGL